MYACMCLSYFHHVQLFAIPWTIAHQVPLSMELSRQEYWSGLPFPSPGDLLNPGHWTWVPCIEGGFFTDWATREAYIYIYFNPYVCVCVCVYICSALSLSCVQLFATPWTVVLQAPLTMGILQARILEWVTMPSSRGSSLPRDQTQVSHIASRFFTSWVTWEVHICVCVCIYIYIYVCMYVYICI